MPQKNVVEDVLGEFGFRLVWCIGDFHAQVTAYKITVLSETGKPMFNRRDWQSLPDPVERHEEAEVYLDGRIKWDGCSDLDLGSQHFCGAAGFSEHCDLLRFIYFRAFELMMRDRPDAWPNPVPVE